MTKEKIIDNILTAININLKTFAIDCGIAPNSLRMSIKRDVLTDETITKIHNKYKVRKKYLASGEGPIFEKNIPKNPGEEHTLENFIKLHVMAVEELQYSIAKSKKEIDELKKQKIELINENMVLKKEKEELLRKISTQK